MTEKLTLYRFGTGRWVDTPELPERLQGTALAKLQTATFISEDDVARVLRDLLAKFGSDRVGYARKSSWLGQTPGEARVREAASNLGIDLDKEDD